MCFFLIKCALLLEDLFHQAIMVLHFLRRLTHKHVNIDYRCDVMKH